MGAVVSTAQKSGDGVSEQVRHCKLQLLLASYLPAYSKYSRQNCLTDFYKELGSNGGGENFQASGGVGAGPSK